MALTDTEKVLIRGHLGYPNTTTVHAMNFGAAIPIQTLFLLNKAMEVVLPQAEPRVRMIMQVLDQIECKMIQGQAYLAADAVGDIKVRQGHINQLEEEYRRWGVRLAELFGVPYYKYSERFNGSRIGNVRVG